MALQEQKKIVNKKKKIRVKMFVERKIFDENFV